MNFGLAASVPFGKIVAFGNMAAVMTALEIFAGIFHFSLSGSKRSGDSASSFLKNVQINHLSLR